MASAGDKIKPIILTQNKLSNEKSLIQFFKSFEVFSNSFYNKISNNEPIFSTIELANPKLKSRNKDSMFLSKSLSTMKTRSGIFGFLDFEVMARHLFFFLELPDLCKNLFNVNQNWHKAYKTHLNARIYVLSEETRMYENVNIDIVQSIRTKRDQFYQEYELETPLQFIDTIKGNDSQYSSRSGTLETINK